MHILWKGDGVENEQKKIHDWQLHLPGIPLEPIKNVVNVKKLINQSRGSKIQLIYIISITNRHNVMQVEQDNLSLISCEIGRFSWKVGIYINKPLLRIQYNLTLLYSE